MDAFVQYLICWDVFRLLFFSPWTEFNGTWREARYQRPMPCLCFSDWLENQDGHSGLWLAETFRLPLCKCWMPGIGRNLTDDREQDLNILYLVCFFFRAYWKTKVAALDLWLAETFSASPLQSLNGIRRILTGSEYSTSSTKCFWDDRKTKIAILASDSASAERNSLKGSEYSTSSTKCVCFELTGQPRWPLWPLIVWDIFDCPSATAEQNLMKLDRKQEINIFNHVYVFRADRSSKMTFLVFDWSRYVRLPLQPLNWIWRN